MADQLVSVVIPTYNRADCIESSMMSVLGQSYANLELIVVDDGSTDDTRRVVEGVGDPRVRYAYQANAGACVARNHGVDLARGELVAFQDSDDLWLPVKLERQVAALDATGAGFCTCRMEVVRRYAGKDADAAPTVVPAHDFNREDMDFEALITRNFISTQMLVGRRAVFLEERFDPQMPRLQDWELALRLISAYEFAFVDEVLVRHLIGDDGISRDPSKFMVAFDRIREKHADYLASHRETDADMLLGAAMRSQTFALAKELYLRSFGVRHDPLTLLHLIHSRFLLRDSARTRTDGR